MTDRRTTVASPSLGPRQMGRNLLSRPGMILAIFLAVGVSTFLLAATPRLLEDVSREDLGATVSDAPVHERNIEVERLTRIGAGPPSDPMQRVRSQGEAFIQRSMPESVQEIIQQWYFLLESPQFAITALPGNEPPHPFPMFLRFRYQDQVDDEIRVIAGRLPREQEPVEMLVGTACPADVDLRQELFDHLSESQEPLTDDEGNEIECRIDEVSVYEVAVSQITADDLGLAIGDQMVLRPNGEDRLLRAISADELDYQLLFSISGVIELSDRNRDYWYGDDSLHRPWIQEDPDVRIIFATGLMSPDAYDTILSDVGGGLMRYGYRHFTDPVAVQESNLEVLTADLLGFEDEFKADLHHPSAPRVNTRLSELIAQHLVQRTETIGFMSIGVATLFSAATALILVLASMMAARATRALVLLHNRGGSRAQLALSRVYESMLLIGPPAVAGYLIAEQLLPETESLTSMRLAAALSFVAVMMFIISTWRASNRPLGELQREDVAHGDRSRSLVAEISVVVLAVASIFMLRRRGQIEDGIEAADFDWLLSVAPAALMLAAGLVTAAAYPSILRATSWIASHGRGFVGFVGFKRLVHRSAGGPLPLVIVLVCVSAAVFASITSHTVENGQAVSSFQEVGADFAIRGQSHATLLPSTVDLSGLDGLDATARASAFPGAEVTQGILDMSAYALAVDSADYQEVLSGTESGLALPAFLTDGVPALGTEHDPIPAIFSDEWNLDFRPSVGDKVTVGLGRSRPVLEVRAIWDRFPSVPSGRSFVILDRGVLNGLSDFDFRPTVEFVKAPRDAATVLEQTVTSQTSAADVESRYGFLDSLTNDPFVAWVSEGFTVIFWFAGALAVISGISALAVVSARRKRDFGYLATVGMSRKQAMIMTVVEQIPTALLAIAVGALAGVGIALAIEPAINYSAFTGDLVDASTHVDVGSIAAVAGVLLASVLGAIVILVVANRGRDLAQTLKVGDE